MNWYRLITSQRRGGRRKRRSGPYSDYPRYNGPAALVTFMGTPAVIGKTYALRADLAKMGFQFQEVLMDGSPLEGGQVAVIPGAWVRGAVVTPEESQLLAQLGIDVSTQGLSLPQFNPQAVQEAPVEPGMEQPLPEGDPNIQPEVGAQSDEANQEMLHKLRTASNYQDLTNVVQEQLNKLTEIMTNPNLTEEQAKLKEDFMRFMKSAHKYSLNNAILIFMQNRNASIAGGAKNFWEGKGYEVSPGQEPIWILGPTFWSPRLPPEEYAKMAAPYRAQGLPEKEVQKRVKDRTKRLSGFKNLPVYDVSQMQPIEGWTDENGNPPFDYGEFHKSYLNQFNTPDEYIDTLYTATEAAMSKMGIDVGEEDTGMAGGYSSGGEVRYQQGAAGARRMNVVFHEFAHEVLHWDLEKKAKNKRNADIPDKVTREIEAESTAFLLMQAFDLQADPESSARYLLLWKVEPKQVMARQQEIHGAFTKIFNAVRDQLDKMVPAQPAQPQPGPVQTQPAQEFQSPQPTQIPPAVASGWYGLVKTAQFEEFRTHEDPYEDDKPSKLDININLNKAVRTLGNAMREDKGDIKEDLRRVRSYIMKAQRMVDFAL